RARARLSPTRKQNSKLLQARRVKWRQRGPTNLIVCWNSGAQISTVKIMSGTNLIPGKHVVATDFDGGEGIIVELNTKKYYQLNETAMVVWKGLEKGKTLNEIVADITASYEVAPDQATLSVQRIVDNFQSYRLVGVQ